MDLGSSENALVCPLDYIAHSKLLIYTDPQEESTEERSVWFLLPSEKLKCSWAETHGREGEPWKQFSLEG